MAANAESAVSTGALKRIYHNQQVENPVLQCLQIKQLQSKNSTDVERYRCVFSDIDNFIQSMLGTSLNSLVQEEKLKKGSFVKIKQYQAQDVKGKKIIVILDCEVLTELGEREKIGVPGALEGSAPQEDGGPAPKKEEDQKPSGINSNNFYGNKPAQPPQQRQQSSRPSGTTSSSHGTIYPIEALSPYAHKWTIRGRCTYKGDVRTWHKSTGEGKLFSCNFLDESGEIRATAFNDQCDALFDIIQEGGVYYVSSPCAVKIPQNRRFNNTNHDYELTFERDTVVEKAEDQDSAPKVKYNFVALGDLDSVEKDSTIDAIGVLKEVAETSQITSKSTGKPYDKRDVTLVDQSGFQCRLTIWGATATNFDIPEGSVVAFKGCRVSDFNGKSLSLLSSGSMSANPQMDEAYSLKGWYDAQGTNESFNTHAAVLGAVGSGRKDDWKTIAQVKEENLGMSEQTDYFTLKATIAHIKADGTIAYPACQSEGCNKKVIENNPGEWSCERCEKHFPAPEWRYIVSVNVSDWTGSCYLSSFDDVGRLLFGMTANELIEMKENDEGRYKETVAEATLRTWVWRVRAKLDTFQDQQRVRYQVSGASPVNYAQEASRLADVLKQYNMEQDNGLFVPA